LKNITAKICQAMEKIGYLQKDKKMQGGGGYTYLSEMKITEEVQKVFAALGLTMYPIASEVLHDQIDTTSKMKRHLLMKCTFRIADKDSGESIDVQTLGEGQDNGDKTAYKCMTGALKYAERQMLLIPTGDGPDDHASDGLSGPAASAAAPNDPFAAGPVIEKEINIRQIWATLSPELKDIFNTRKLPEAEVVQLFKIHKGDQVKITAYLKANSPETSAPSEEPKKEEPKNKSHIDRIREACNFYLTRRIMRSQKVNQALAETLWKKSEGKPDVFCQELQKMFPGVVFCPHCGGSSNTEDEKNRCNCKNTRTETDEKEFLEFFKALEHGNNKVFKDEINRSEKTFGQQYQAGTMFHLYNTMYAANKAKAMKEAVR